MTQLRTDREALLVFSRSVPAVVRQHAADTEEIYCQMCGVTVGDIDECTGRQAKFRASLVPNNGLSFRSRFPNLRILCSTCDQGTKNITGEKPTGVWLLSQVRRAGLDEQKAVYDWLVRKLGKPSS
ncbi:MAG TPA: hypothetical protein VME86_16865 [Acidobacteriaceae bacterium]|nr:hypothetical protein [Acidobacteriaceae bacterium]